MKSKIGYQILLPFISLFIFAQQVTAQQMFSGIKAGLNFSTLRGEAEQLQDGTKLESMTTATGFHVGALLGYAFNERFGVQAELLYAQKGGRYAFEADNSYLRFKLPNGTQIDDQGGKKKIVKAFSLNYLDLPMLVYYRPIKFVRLGVGPNVGLRLGASANGEVIYDGIKLVSDASPLIVRLNYSYGKDELYGFNGELNQNVVYNNSIIQVPSEVGAYFFEESDEGNYFKTFDVGLNADLTFFLSRGISLGLRVNYGLTDVTNNAYDRSELLRNTARADVDRNLSYQISFAFHFYR